MPGFDAIVKDPDALTNSTAGWPLPPNTQIGVTVNLAVVDGDPMGAHLAVKVSGYVEPQPVTIYWGDEEPDEETGAVEGEVIDAPVEDTGIYESEHIYEESGSYTVTVLAPGSAPVTNAFQARTEDEVEAGPIPVEDRFSGTLTTTQQTMPAGFGNVPLVDRPARDDSEDEEAEVPVTEHPATEEPTEEPQPA
jgi:hypothetical protein